MDTRKQPLPGTTPARRKITKEDFFLKYSRQLELEKQKLHARVRRLEAENSQLEEKFRGSVEQREQIKRSADTVMEMLVYLNTLIDKFVRPSRKTNPQEATKSEKAILMDGLVQEKRDFDANMLGICEVEAESRTGVRRSRGKPPPKERRREVALEQSRVQEELNQSIEQLTFLKNEILDSVLQGKPGLGAGQNEEAVEEEHPGTMYYSEEKGLDCIPLKIEDLPSSHKTEQPQKKAKSFFKLKGRREKVSISIEECNRLFQDTLPKSRSRKKRRRQRSQRKPELRFKAQTKTSKSSREPKSSVESQHCPGLYNRHNSLFRRNRLHNGSKESLPEARGAINVWGKYTLELPQSGESKHSGRNQRAVLRRAVCTRSLRANA